MTSTNAHRISIVFFVLAVAFCLTSAGVLRSNNNAIGIAPPALAAKSKGSSSLCQLAGDTQCVTEQGNFNTVSMTTKLNSSIWNIIGQVKNVGTSTQMVCR